MPRILALTILCAVPALAQSPDVAALERRVAEARAAADRAVAGAAAAEKRQREAKEAAAAADLKVVGAETGLRLARGRSESVSSAASMVTEEAERIRDLVARRNEATDDAQRDLLTRQIEAMQESLRRVTRRYGDEARGRHEAERGARTALETARKELDAALAAQLAADAAVEQAAKSRRDAEANLARAWKELTAASESLAPPWLREMRVEQGGRLVYAARWETDDSVRRYIDEQIAELERQIADLETAFPPNGEDRKRYLRERQAAAAELYRCQQQIDANEFANDLSLVFWRFGAIVGTAADVMLIGKGIALAWAAGVREAGGLATAGAVELAARRVTQKFAQARVFQRLGWRAVAPVGGGTVRQIGKELIEWEARRLASLQPWKKLALPFAAWKLRSDYKKMTASGYRIPAHVEQALEQASAAIEAFEDRRVESECSRVSRDGFEKMVLPEVNRAYMEALNEIRSLDESFWRTIVIGKITTPDSVIGLAEGKAGVMYWEACTRVYTALYQMALDDLDATEFQVTWRRERIAALRAARTTAPSRALSVTANDRLDASASAPRATVTLAFEGGIGETPTCQIGEGHLAATDVKDDPDGLPLPEAAKEGAVLVRLTGSAASWTGTFPTAPLRKFADRPDGIRVTVTAKDPAGKALDADPTSAAGRGADGTWLFWEEFRGLAGGGRGGPDTWHVLNLRVRDATSWCFVVDASGSMKEGGRMDAVKASAKGFVDRMKPGDEVALFVFFDCGDIRLLKPFTTDKESILLSLAPVQPSQGTPLGESMARGADYLLRAGMYDNRVLVVLTDGLETCGGHPLEVARRFRDRIRIEGYGGGGGRPNLGGGEAAPPRPPEPPKREPIRIEPSDTTRYRVETDGARVLPNLVLVERRYHEWGDGTNGWVLVTEKRYAVWYAGDAKLLRWGVNPRPVRSQTLAAASGTDGQKGIDATRAEWSAVPGTDRATAMAELERAVKGIVGGGGGR